MFTGMHLNQRELHQHVEFEPDNYYAAFTAELEISASPMWSHISHLKGKASTVYTYKTAPDEQNSLEFSPSRLLISKFAVLQENQT